MANFQIRSCFLHQLIFPNANIKGLNLLLSNSQTINCSDEILVLLIGPFPDLFSLSNLIFRDYFYYPCQSWGKQNNAGILYQIFCCWKYEMILTQVKINYLFPASFLCPIYSLYHGEDGRVHAVTGVHHMASTPSLHGVHLTSWEIRPKSDSHGSKSLPKCWSMRENGLNHKEDELKIHHSSLMQTSKSQLVLHYNTGIWEGSLSH
jgi:hypothetical protein